MKREISSLHGLLDWERPPFRIVFRRSQAFLEPRGCLLLVVPGYCTAKLIYLLLDWRKIPTGDGRAVLRLCLMGGMVHRA